MWYIYVYFSLIALCVGYWAFLFKELPSGLKLLGAALALTLLMEGYAGYLMVQNVNNHHIYLILIPAQYVLFSLIFFRELSGMGERKVIIFSLPVYLLAIILLTFAIQSSNEYNSYSRLIKNILLASWVLLYYREVFMDLKVNRLEAEPMFWISTGLFFYSLGNVFVDGLMNHLLAQSRGWAKPIYYINIFLGILLHATFLISFLLSRKNHLPQSSD